MATKNQRANPFTAVGTPERRQAVLLVMLLVVVLAFTARLVYVQVFAGPGLAAAAVRDRSFTYTEPALRGSIVDSAGTVMAASAQTYRVVVNRDAIPAYRTWDADGEVTGYGAAAAARDLAPILDRDVNTLGAELVGDDKYSILARDVAPEVWREIAALGIPGVSAEETFERVYPNGNTAGQILGWVNAEGEGAAGLESTLNDRLLGTDGEFTVEIGATGQVIPTGQNASTPPVPGCDVRLTVNADLNWQAQTVVDDAVDRYGAEWGAAVVIDVDTGRILALADSDVVDPNDPGASRYTGSHAVQDVYDPGSTGKVLTVLSALEEGVVTPTTSVEDPYRLTTENGQTFRDHTEHPDQMLTTTGVLAESANTGTVNIGSRMSDETRYEYMQRLGWGERTGMGMPGETAGILHHYEDWDGAMRYTTMFGQGVSVNLLQNTAVFSTIANGGVRMPMSIVDGYDCADGYDQVDPGDPVQVVSEESSDQMIRMLESVVTDAGTGENAAIEGYRIAGKTGTAQMPDANGELTQVAASFVGIAPADDPQIAVGVVMYNPDTGIYGGTIAAPVFQEITAFTLQSLGVPPSDEEAEPYPLRPDDE
ncbi:peptidoglycan D,D-transpeptidase FtsI family protein [Ruania alba]|uniref:Cell division protein FtsI (Penicillin-binding protein 3) n=1 Tax=Ruania alba TaxID=648782 RepID=A0A1H5E9I2_9MICO|nr:penicillin-binding protein 2 [Ruania alba]SED87710.1 cell division protein FtsI (penicillin-binding protein 3) [Ruania alba]